jgi:hypothetical protein
VRFARRRTEEARFYIPKKPRSAYGGKTHLGFHANKEEDALAKRADAQRSLDEVKNVAPRTYEDRKRYAEKCLILPNTIGDVLLQDLAAETLGGLYGRLVEKKIGVGAINHVHISTGPSANPSCASESALRSQNQSSRWYLEW